MDLLPIDFQMIEASSNIGWKNTMIFDPKATKLIGM